jgi:UDPglucose 6-dehydrogenase
MKNTLATGIVGYGTVGQATALLFEDVAIYDPPKGYTDLSALARCTVSFVCVPTPTSTNGRCDLSFVYDAVSRVAPILSNNHVLVIRSTVPPGTVRQLQEGYPNTHLASNPEFLRAHRLEEDALSPSRVVIGADTVYSRQRLLKLYHSRLGRGVPYVITDSVTAEFIKYVANCFLATKITYAQEIRKATQHIGTHYEDVVRAVGLDPRIGQGDEWFLDGLNDECLPKDLEAFISLLRSWRTDSRLLETVLNLKDEPLRGRPVAARKRVPPQASRQRK